MTFGALWTGYAPTPLRTASVEHLRQLARHLKVASRCDRSAATGASNPADWIARAPGLARSARKVWREIRRRR